MDLFGLYELQVDHDASPYSNPYDLDEIELQATYTAPSGREIAFWGFHDGDGLGAIEGDVWKARFMPDEVGLWQVAWQFSDGSASGAASFTVGDEGTQKGPMARDWRFMTDGRGDEIDICGYGMMVWEEQPGFDTEFDFVSSHADMFAQNAFNLIQLAGVKPLHPYEDRKLNPAHWHPYENLLRELQERGIYSFHFYYLSQPQIVIITDEDMNHWQRTRIARVGAFWSDVGVAPTYEWPEFMESAEITAVQTQYAALDPFPRLMTAHDSSVPGFEPWLGFSSRQAEAHDLFFNHNRTGGRNGGIDEALSDWPIVGSEDLWYLSPWGQAQNETEIRHGAWNELLAGVIPVLSTWHWITQMPTPPDMMQQYVTACSFVHERTNYRDWEIRDDWQTATQILSSTPDESELIVYALNGAPEMPAGTYDLTWLEPITGEVVEETGVNTGGTLSSPFSADDVGRTRPSSLEREPNILSWLRNLFFPTR